MKTGWGQLLTGVIGSRRHLGQIKDKISNLPKELILIDEPVERSRPLAYFGGHHGYLGTEGV